MKKILVVLAILILGGLGATFFLGGGVQKEVENFITQQSEFEVKKSEFNRGFGKSNGILEGLVKKEQIYAKIDESVDKFLLGEEKEIIDKVRNSAKAIFKDDFEFRYDYEVNHSVFGVANGFEINGNITILTPSYAEISNKLFNTATPLEINSKVGISGSEIMSKLVDLKGEEFALDGVSLLSNLTNENEVKSLKLSFDKFALNLDDVGKKYGANDVKIEIGGVDYEINFVNPIKTENLSDMISWFGNYDYDISAKSFGAVASEGNLFMLSDISSVGKSELGGEFVGIKDKSKIGTLEFYGLQIKNIFSDVNMQIDKKFVDYIAKNGVDFADRKEDEVEKIIAQILEKGLKITLNELSLENTKSDKLSLKSNFSVSDFSDKEKIWQSLKFDGSFLSSTSASNFMSAYESFALFALLAEPAIKEYAKPQGDGFVIDFSFDPKTKDFIVNDKRIPTGLDDDENEKIASLTAANIFALKSDLVAYHLSQGKFADEFKNMTNVKFDQISATSVHLLSKDKKCIKVSFFDKTDEKDAYIKFEKGDDQEHRICQKIYEHKDIKEQLENPEMAMF